MLDQLHPDIGFALFSMPTLIPLLVLWGGDTDKRFLSQASQHGFLLWLYRQHRLQEQATPFRIANLPNASDLASMRQIDISPQRIMTTPQLNSPVRLEPLLDEA